ncbi:hypothetical protein ABPG74_000074 [Tetrahymena malaccensis]
MSKYQTESTKVRKDEVEGHQTSFQQDKQYSYSRASQHGSKILDNVNQILNNNNNKLGDKNILDMMDNSFQDNQKQEAIQNQEAVQNNNNNEKRESVAVQSNLSLENNSQVQQQLEKNNETEQDQDSKLKASERLFQFFKKAPDSVSQSSKNSATLLMNSLSLKSKGELGKIEQKKDLKSSAFEEEQIIDEDEFANMDEQNDFNQDDKLKNNQKKKQEVGGKVNNPQDFGNISEIQEKKNLRENNDESAQDVDLQDLLNNPNKKKLDDESIKRNTILEQVNTNQNSIEQVKLEEAERKQSIENNNLSQNSMRNSKRIGNSSLSPQNNAESEEKRKRIEEAQRKKRELEEELKIIQSEIAQINNANDEKKKKENKFIKYSEISEDKEAQEHALSLIRKMNLVRKEKELKMQKERDMFNKLLQEDIKESHERQMRIKEKMNEEKKEKISQKLEQIRIRSEERKMINKQSNLIIKDIKKDLQVNNPDERYKQEVELPELEKRKKELAEKRKLYKPIDIQEIKEHAKKHDEEIKIRKLQAKTNVLAEYNNLEGDSYKYPKTSALNKVLEDDKLFKMKEVIEMQKKKEQIERRKEYAKLVKEVHVPRVKPKPNLDSMENQQLYDDESQNNYNPQQQSQAKSHNIIRTPNNFGINQQSHRAKKVGIGFSSNSNLSPSNQQSRVNRISYKPNKNGNVNRSQGREQSKEQQNFSKQNQQQEFYNRTDDLSNQKSSLYNPAFDDNIENNDNNNINNRASNLYAGKSSYSSNSAQNKPVKQPKQFKPPAIEEPPKPPQKKYQVDYIQELRKNREEQEKKVGKKSKLEDWEKYKYDPSLSSNEKYKFILQSANRLEHNAKLKELRSNNNNDFDAQEQANNLYIDSIKAKLALLDNIN